VDCQRDDSLDIGWLKEDDGGDGSPLSEPAVLATNALQEMEAIMEDLRGILVELGEDVEEVVE
jgi:type I restriction enzyme M protein